MADPQALVSLKAVDEDVLVELVTVATTRASADEVTPPLTPGLEWTSARVEWLRSYHRDRRQGLHSPRVEATWAVLLDQRVVGSARLKHTDEEGVVETGLWLARDARGEGLGTAVLAAVLQHAGDLGAAAVSADTTTGNLGALGALRRLGFALTSDEGHAVHAVRSLAPPPPDAEVE